MSVVYFKGGPVYFQRKTTAVNLINTVHCYNHGAMTKVETVWHGCVVTDTVTIVTALQCYLPQACVERRR